MKRFFQTTSLLCITLCSILLSCEDTDVCDQPKLMKELSLVVVFEGPTKERTSIDSLYVEDQSGKVLYESSSKTEKVKLPLNFNNGSVDFYFKPSKNDAKKAKITVKGRPEEYYVSIACGYRLVYKEVSYDLLTGSNWIKDIHVLQKQIIDGKEHLAIQF